MTEGLGVVHVRREAACATSESGAGPRSRSPTETRKKCKNRAHCKKINHRRDSNPGSRPISQGIGKARLTTGPRRLHMFVPLQLQLVTFTFLFKLTTFAPPNHTLNRLSWRQAIYARLRRALCLSPSARIPFFTTLNFDPTRPTCNLQLTIGRRNLPPPLSFFETRSRLGLGRHSLAVPVSPRVNPQTPTSSSSG